jgi:hypothetical protein
MHSRKHTGDTSSKGKKKPYQKPTLTPLTLERAMILLWESADNGNQDAERTLEQLRRLHEGKKAGES